MTDITLICLSLLMAILTMMVAAEVGQGRRSRHLVLSSCVGGRGQRWLRPLVKYQTSIIVAQQGLTLFAFLF